MAEFFKICAMRTAICEISEENKDGKNVLFEFKHVFTKITHLSGWINSPTFETPKILGVKFLISASINNVASKVSVRVIKDDIREAVSIIKISFDGLFNSTRRVVDWKNMLLFESLIIPFDFDVCHRYIDYPKFYAHGKSPHEYTIPIICEIIWNGFVEDFY
ncbi:Protein of unknown function [Cotesia congregata]|uniref:Uncharacterized protein n=1 Tax=Cotesia congregata TaxID=51543 RepID=A0A8J2E232_COTCN|nr:Protein of unknown function [Cotesia congregata]